MNEKLNEIGIESLDKLREYVESAEAFASEQIPLVLQEMLRWEICSTLFLILVNGIILSLILYLYRFVYKYMLPTFDPEKMSNDDRLGYFLGNLVSIAVVILFSGLLLEKIYHLVFVTCAPRLFLLEKFAEIYSKFNQ